MERNNLKKMIFGGLVLMSIAQITNHYIQTSDYIYGGLIGIALGIMFFGLFKMVKIKNTSNR